MATADGCVQVVGHKEENVRVLWELLLVLALGVMCSDVLLGALLPVQRWRRCIYFHVVLIISTYGLTLCKAGSAEVQENIILSGFGGKRKKTTEGKVRNSWSFPVEQVLRSCAVIIEGLLLNATNLCWRRKHVPSSRVLRCFAASRRREKALRARGAIGKETWREQWQFIKACLFWG